MHWGYRQSGPMTKLCPASNPTVRGDRFSIPVSWEMTDTHAIHLFIHSCTHYSNQQHCYIAQRTTITWQTARSTGFLYFSLTDMQGTLRTLPPPCIAQLKLSADPQSET